MQHTKPLQKRECLVASGEFYVEFYGALTGRPSKGWKGKCYIFLHFHPVSILLWSLLDLDFSVSFFDFLVNFVGNLPAIFLCTFVRSQFYRGRCWVWIFLWVFWISWRFFGMICFGFPDNFLGVFLDLFRLYFSALLSQFYRGRCWIWISPWFFFVNFILEFGVFFLEFLPAISLCTLARSQFDRSRCWIWISPWFFGFLREFVVEFHNDFCWGFLGNFFRISSCYISLHFRPISILSRSLLANFFSCIHSTLHLDVPNIGLVSDSVFVKLNQPGRATSVEDNVWVRTRETPLSFSATFWNFERKF